MTQTLDYQTLKTYDAFELRLYGPQAIVEATQHRFFEAVGKNFRALAAYINGSNRTQQAIPMTTPVLTVPVDESHFYTLQFFLPAPWIVDTAPLPKQSNVALKAVPPRKIAALRYNGLWSEERFLRKVEQLKTDMAKAELVQSGLPMLARYNAPYWPPFFMRHNEVWIAVE
jgi:hypothetical protein